MSSQKQKQGKLVKLKDEDVQIKTDLKVEEFRYFSALIQNNIQEDWIKERKLVQIKKSFETFMNVSYKQDFIIVIAVDPCYNLSYKKNGFLIVKIDKVVFFIYRPKPIDLPRIKPLEEFKIKKVDLEPIAEFIQTIKHQNISELEFMGIQRVKDYLAGLLIKYAEEYEKDPSSYETIIVTKIRNILGIVFKAGFWQIFLSKKMETMFELSNEERYLEFQFQPLVAIGEDKKTPVYRIIIFQKQGPSFKLIEKLKIKSREILSFFFLLLFFITLVTCKSTNEIADQSTIKNAVCHYRQEVLGFCAIGFIGLITQRMFGKFVQRGKNKQKFLNKLEAENKKNQ